MGNRNNYKGLISDEEFKSAPRLIMRYQEKNPILQRECTEELGHVAQYNLRGSAPSPPLSVPHNINNLQCSFF